MTPAVGSGLEQLNRYLQQFVGDTQMLHASPAVNALNTTLSASAACERVFTSVFAGQNFHAKTCVYFRRRLMKTVTENEHKVRI